MFVFQSEGLRNIWGGRFWMPGAMLPLAWKLFVFLTVIPALNMCCWVVILTFWKAWLIRISTALAKYGPIKGKLLWDGHMNMCCKFRSAMEIWILCNFLGKQIGHFWDGEQTQKEYEAARRSSSPSLSLICHRNKVVTHSGRQRNDTEENHNQQDDCPNRQTNREER